MKALGQEIERQLNVDSNNLNFEGFHFPKETPSLWGDGQGDR
jgi:hypothetical protein